MKQWYILLKKSSKDHSSIYQYIDYLKLDYSNIIPLVKKYFSPAKGIINIINNIEKNYNLIYDNICVLFYRGNDKMTETDLCKYDEYLVYANLILNATKNIFCELLLFVQYKLFIKN